jgi:very-short-patch-repair endonuclease
MKIPPDREIAKRAQELRHSPTIAEEALWKHLRGRRLEGRKFRRQVWIGPFIVDFVCLDARLVVEADGSQHVENAEYDHHRSRFLETEGFHVLRFWNNEITFNIAGVLELIRFHLLERTTPSPSHRHAAGPSLSPEGRGACESSNPGKCD